MVTTRGILNKLHDEIFAEYKRQLAALPIKKGTRECLIDGFSGGLRAGIHHTCAMLDVKIDEEAK